MVTKKEVAAQLSEAARLLDVLAEDPRRAGSLISAARSVEGYPGDFEELYRQGRLSELRGVGPRTERELAALFERGTMPLLEELRARVPESVRELFAVSGLGAKRIGQLWRAGITDLNELQEACSDGRLARLPGFGPKSSANLKEAVAFAIAAREAMRLDEAERLSEAVRSALAGHLSEAVIEPTGEYRRGLETVGTLEFVVAGVARQRLIELSARLFDEVADGDPLQGVLLGRRVRLHLATPETLGLVLALTTGNDEFVARLERRAREKGSELRGSEAGAIHAPSEEALFDWLGVEPVPPELRESAEPPTVPDLIEHGDVRGLVHNHTTWSDGALPLRAMVQAAISAGYAYLAIADHSVSSAVAHGLSVERLRAQADEVAQVRQELRDVDSDFELLHGLEVDILPDGRLDLPDEALARLDYVVASVHQNFSLSRAAQTERIVNAVRHPLVDILAHPTGRLLLRRPGYDVDLEEVLEACAETGTVVEINANPRRLELDWRWLARATSLGCIFSIDPDAHAPLGYEDVAYGVTIARKGALTRHQVVNCAPSGREFLAGLPKRRGRM